MIYQSALAAFFAVHFASNVLAVALPATLINDVVSRDSSVNIGPNVPSCYNSWETVTNDPVVQYWYMIVPNSGVKADRMWNHLNLNGCAPTEHKYYSTPKNNGVALTFHTSEACTAARVSHAYRSSSDPPYNIGCVFTGKEEVNSGEIGESVIDGAFEAALELLH